MTPLFIIASLIAVFLIILFLEVSLEKDEDSGGGWQSTIVVAGFLIAYWFLDGSDNIRNAFSYVINNVVTVILYVLGYIAIGGIWSIVRWYFFLSFKSNKALDKINTMDSYSNSYSKAFTIPTASENKYRIMTWMVYWPFSAVWTLINQPVRNTFRFVYIKLEGVYNSISNRMFADVQAKFDKKKQEIKEAEERKEKEKEARKK